MAVFSAVARWDFCGKPDSRVNPPGRTAPPCRRSRSPSASSARTSRRTVTSEVWTTRASSRSDTAPLARTISRINWRRSAANTKLTVTPTTVCFQQFAPNSRSCSHSDAPSGIGPTSPRAMPRRTVRQLAVTSAGSRPVRPVPASPRPSFARVQLPGHLGDRARQRRVDGEGVGDLLDRQVVVDGDRDRVDQLAGPRRDDHAADHDAGARAAEDLDEAVPDALHLRARVAQQRQLHHPGVDLARCRRRPGCSRRWRSPGR